MDAPLYRVGIGWALGAAVALVCATAASARPGNPAFRVVQSGAERPQPGNVPPDSLKEFQRNLEAYLALREALAQRLEPLELTENAAELAARHASLAAALREARRDATPGDLIPSPVAEAIRSIVAADYRHRDREAKEATLHEVPDDLVLIVNRIYPQDAALSTVPPLLLAKLPLLPDNLQYRFVDRHVVILDGDTHIVVDFVTNALPPP